MAFKTLITLGYILVFWGSLPVLLAALAIWGQSFFGPRLRLPGLQAPGIALAAVAAIMLTVSIVQFTRASGSLPVSAFPPRKLIRAGVFGVWRHPVYLFSILFFSGLGVAAWPAGFLFVAFPVLVLGTVYYAAHEEAGLEKRFGEAYRGHRRQTSIVVWRLVHILRWVATAVCRFFFHFEVSGRENGRIDPPFFVICAHRNYLDPVFVSLAFNVPVHFITTAERFRSPLSRAFFMRLLALPKKRYTPDVRNALEIRRRLAEGCAVGVFPEAERSWTGEMLDFKPGAVKLLQRFSGLPIVPVRLQGAYEAWPRWSPRPRRTHVTAFVGKPVFAKAGESPSAFEARVRALIDPPRAPQARPRPIRANSIEALIYRCPECLSFDAVRSGRDGAFGCIRCQARFEMLSDRSIRKIGLADAVPLAEITGRIFVGSAIVASPATPRDRFVANGTTLFVDLRGRFKTGGKGRLELTAAGLDFIGPGGPVGFDLAAVRAVLIEGARILQIYSGRPAVLSQLTLTDQSALKWQHLIAGAVRSVRGTLPDTA